MKKWTLAVLVAACASDAQATVVVALVSADRIVIAADSRAGGSDGRSDSACKVYWNGEVAFTASGHVYATGGYAFEAIGNDVLSFKGSTADRLRHAVSRLARRDRSGVAPGTTILIVASFNMGRRGPSLSVEQLRIPLPTDHVQAVVTVDAGVLVSRPEGATTAIDSIAVQAWLARRPGEAEMIQMARRFVSEQAEREPAKVGGPVDMLVLDGAGGRWIDRKPFCRP